MYYMAVVTQRELGRRKSSAGRARAGARLFAWSPRRTLTLLHFFLYPHFCSHLALSRHFTRFKSSWIVSKFVLGIFCSRRVTG